MGGFGFVTWKVPKGYSVLEMSVGMDDTYPYKKKPGVFRLLLDGEVLKEAEVQRGRKAERWSVPVASGQSVQVYMECAPGKASQVLIMRDR